MLLFSRKRARQLLDDGAARSDESTLERTLENRQSILDRVINSAALAPYIEQVKVLLQMLQDYAKGEYRAVPWWGIGAVATALLYILTPLDAMPDFIPLLGFLDDAVVLKLCLDMLDKDLKQYLQFKSHAAASDQSPETDATGK